MKILIIGGTGLISTAITRALLERGDEVTIYNRGQSAIRFEGAVRRIIGDRRDAEQFEKQVREAGPFEVVIDMICYRPEEAESTLRAVRGIAGQLIVCSTVDVYARPTRRFPIKEDEPRGGVSVYGKQKAMCEKVLLEAWEREGIPVTILRPAQTYGEGGPLIHSLGWSTTFFDRLRKGKPVIVHGDGQSLWCACHVEDVAAAFVGACGNETSYGRCYNVTGEEWMTWDGYHQTVARAIGAPEPRLVHIPTEVLCAADERAIVCRENFQFNNIFDTSAARRDLGFAYTIAFEEGVRRTYAWLEAHGAIESSETDPAYDRLVAAWEGCKEAFLAACRRGGEEGSNRGELKV
ncbi:MAG: NAD-dependent epimerase/dehydratase family protein [bacterium]|nr:NAD-dependent epimerase/dehydratase family protein [bacterium]